MDNLILTPAILHLNSTLTGKVLFAQICQLAAQSKGTCSATNKELSQATGMHLSTVSELVNRLAKDELLRISLERDNHRSLIPVAEYVLPYSSITDSPSSLMTNSPYPPITDSPISPSRSQKSMRICPITGLTITHQPVNHFVANYPTLDELFVRDEAQFNQLYRRIMGQYPFPESNMQVYDLASRVRSKGKRQRRLERRGE